MPIHAFAIDSGKLGVERRYIISRVLLADLDVVWPLNRREIGDLIDLLQIGDADRFQIAAREEVMLFQRRFAALDRRINHGCDFGGAEERIRVEFDECGLVGE